MLLLLAGVLLGVALVVVKSVGAHVEGITAPPLPDLLHELLPVLNVGFVATGGFLALIAAIAWYAFIARPEEAAYVLASVATLIFVRAAFVGMTHLGAPIPRADDLALFGVMPSLYFTQDLFPSGHTAIPVLMAFLSTSTFARRIFVGLTVVLGSSVLLMHVHYSIDVFAAPFVAYGVSALLAPTRRWWLLRSA